MGLLLIKKLNYLALSLLLLLGHGVPLHHLVVEVQFRPSLVKPLQCGFIHEVYPHLIEHLHHFFQLLILLSELPDHFISLGFVDYCFVLDLFGLVCVPQSG